MRKNSNGVSLPHHQGQPSGPPVTHVLQNLMAQCLRDHLTWREVSIWGGPPHGAGFCQRNLLVRTFLFLKFYSFICFNCNFNFFLRSMFFSSLFLSLSVHWLLSSLPWQNTWRKAPSGNGLGAQGLRALLIREGKAWWPGRQAVGRFANTNSKETERKAAQPASSFEFCPLPSPGDNVTHIKGESSHLN